MARRRRVVWCAANDERESVYMLCICVGRTEENGREMGLAVTYTYSPELQTDSGQILRIRGARLELIANVWPGTWILG